MCRCRHHLTQLGTSSVTSADFVFTIVLAVFHVHTCAIRLPRVAHAEEGAALATRAGRQAGNVVEPSRAGR
jgi:hypothetical protein